MAEIADLYTEILDLFFYCFLIALFPVDHPVRLIVLHVNLSRNHQITTMLVPEIITEVKCMIINKGNLTFCLKSLMIIQVLLHLNSASYYF